MHGAGIELGHRAAVVDLVERHQPGHRQGGGRDQGVAGAHAAQAVVREQGVAPLHQRHARDRHRLRQGRGVFAGEAAHGGARIEREGFARHHARKGGRCRLDAGGHTAVINLVVRRDAQHRQRLGRDAGGNGAGLAEGVVAQQRAAARAHRAAGHRHAHRVAHILGHEYAAGTRSVEGDGVTALHARQAAPRQGGGHRAVVNLARGGHAGDGEWRRADVGRQAADRRKAVVAQ